MIFAFGSIDLKKDPHVAVDNGKPYGKNPFENTNQSFLSRNDIVDDLIAKKNRFDNGKSHLKIIILAGSASRSLAEDSKRDFKNKKSDNEF
jgi:hypothetical protein